ncbi:MAG: YecH family protein [Candidatus Omnitrophica bacterium]|nr:YecH family protein [Candidatus Omnitrophota bacterium]
MSKSIHGHDVMQMMIEENRSYTRETLKQAIYDRFGRGSLFHTCSSDNMTAEELIDFLEGKRKFFPVEKGFQIDADQICDH